MGGEIHKPGTDDGWHGVIAPGGQFEPEEDRYHLYIGLFCPFAHRANLVRHLKGLTTLLPTSVVLPHPRGGSAKYPSWIFPDTADEYPGATPDPLFHSKYLSEIYFRADPHYQGRYSVPLLWDRKLATIVNNESAEILRFLPTAFNALLPPPLASLDLYPQPLRPLIDTLTPWLQSHLNSGVYKAGFASDQAAYDAAVIPVFGALNRLETLVHAHGGPFLIGKQLTELDVRAYATVVRFDMVYLQHFKCNLGTIRHDYPVLNAWLRHVYWAVRGFRESTDARHIKENYTKSMPDLNPRGITPMGPYPDVEPGVPDKDEWKRLKPGGVKMREVEEFADGLPVDTEKRDEEA